MTGRPTLWHGWNPTSIDRFYGCFSLDFWSFTSFHVCFHRPCAIVLDDGAGTFRGAQLTLPTALSPFRPLREPWLLTLYIPKQLQLNGTASSIDNAMSLPPPQTPQRKNWLWRFAIKSLCYLKKKTNETPRNLSGSYLPRPQQLNGATKKWKEISGPATLNPPHPYNAADHKAEFPAQQKTKGFFPCQDVGQLGNKRTWDGKIGNHSTHIVFFQSSSCLWEGRVPPQFRHPTLGFMTCFHWENLRYTCENKSHSYSYGTGSILHVYAGIGLSPQTTLL